MFYSSAASSRCNRHVTPCSFRIPLERVVGIDNTDKIELGKWDRSTSSSDNSKERFSGVRSGAVYAHLMGNEQSDWGERVRGVLGSRVYVLGYQYAGVVQHPILSNPLVIDDIQDRHQTPAGTPAGVGVGLSVSVGIGKGGGWTRESGRGMRSS